MKDQEKKSSNPKEPFNISVRNQLKKLPKPRFNKRKCAHKYLPILDWLPKYNLEQGISDLIAGITVGLTMIPQGIAYALVANLPAQVIISKVQRQKSTNVQMQKSIQLQYGLYSAFMSCFVFLFLGASKDLSIGPEAVLAILTYQISGKGIEHVILLTFLSGIIIFILAIFRLGKTLIFTFFFGLKYTLI